MTPSDQPREAPEALTAEERLQRPSQRDLTILVWRVAFRVVLLGAGAALIWQGIEREQLTTIALGTAAFLGAGLP